jgi:hypothetical protein
MTVSPDGPGIHDETTTSVSERRQSPAVMVPSTPSGAGPRKGMYPPSLVGWMLACLVLFGCLACQHPALAALSCNQSIGPAKAHKLVEQCLTVSPATHPPCNAANDCALIQDEIRRGCAFFDKDKPAFCARYR